ncbi:hypothetical protein COY87_04415 [Candidatus Roizmanbacteria bacterium CG_4_10_14_0_8_um_filter_33_9]|uniref:Thioredoxin-like fold domain-containing protein n=1 Tax=Candidatus Roizmanbacteria bacterium CG_4_10_14_0_8_um_filter_33_9 TaxID=1974826 RepID=A0A2M7QHH3_9BACT|nr:MAG: hypothetical protein COY87_04415 [Candidatus Roizmanbacteria bacterium CG_4_10_14_0_8_um_filter_33_9]
MNRKSIILIIGSVIFLFLLLFGVYKLLNGGGNYYEKVAFVSSSDHIKWSPNKKHVLITYSDLQCPACKVFEEMFTSFESSSSPDFDITKKVTFVYRHFPLYQIHEHAFDTAYAVEAASKQDKFYQMLNAVFMKQSKLDNTKDINAFISQTANKIGLDSKQLLSDMKTKGVVDKVQNDLSSGEQANINATPTFFLDGKKLEPMIPNDLKALLKSL